MSTAVEKFGRVIILKSDKKLELQKFVSFSNLDLGWYDINGEVYPKFKNYIGKKFSLQFAITNSNKHGKEENFQGTLHLPFNLQEIQETDLSYIGTIMQKEIEFGKQLKIISDQDHSSIDLLYSSQIGAMFILSTPGSETVKESSLFPYLSLLILFDDLIDVSSTEVSRFAHDLSFSELSKLAEGTFTLFKTGNKSKQMSKMEIGETISGFNMPMRTMLKLSDTYTTFFELNKKIYDEAEKYGEENAKPFFLALLECYEALALQVSKEWNDAIKTSRHLQGVQLEIEKKTVSTLLVGEAIALVRGVHVSEAIRSNILFKNILNEAALHAAKVNDVISYNKELREGQNRTDKWNEVCVLHVVHDWPLEKALKKVLDDANECLNAVLDTEKILLEIYPEDRGLAEYIRILKEVMCGHIQWSAHITRYHSSMTYDCYVEDN